MGLLPIPSIIASLAQGLNYTSIIVIGCDSEGAVQMANSFHHKLPHL